MSQMLLFGDSPGHALAVPPLGQSWAGTVFHIVLSAISGHTHWGGLRPFSRDGVRSLLDKDLALIWFDVHPQGLERVRVLAGRLCGHMRSQEVWPSAHAEHGRQALCEQLGLAVAQSQDSACAPRERPPFTNALSTAGPPSDRSPLASPRPRVAEGGQMPTCCCGCAHRKSAVPGLPAVRVGPVPGSRQ